MATAPEPVIPLPDAPNPNNRTTFNALAYPWSVALDPWTVQVNNLGINVFSNASEAKASADTATAQAQAAVAAINSPKWVSGTNYAAGAAAWSPTTGRTYRTKVSLNPSTTDPALDLGNWWDLGSLVTPPSTLISGNTTAAGGESFIFTAALTLQLPVTPPAFTTVSFLDLSLSNASEIDPQGGKIRGVTGVMRLNASYAAATLRYIDASTGWV